MNIEITHTHWNTEWFKVPISSGLLLKWLVIAIAIAVVLTFPKLNHWKSKQNGSHFDWISNSFGQNGHHFV